MTYRTIPTVSLLLSIVLLVVGLLGGYYVGQNRSPEVASVTTTTQTVTQTNPLAERGSESVITTSTSTVTCTTSTNTSPNFFYGSCLTVSSASLSATNDRLTLVFSTYGSPDLGVASMTLSGPTIKGVCGFAGNGLPNNGTITKLPGGSGGQIILDVSGCVPTGGPAISVNGSYVYTLVSDWEAGATFTGVVVAH